MQLLKLALLASTAYAQSSSGSTPASIPSGSTGSGNSTSTGGGAGGNSTTGTGSGGSTGGSGGSSGGGGGTSSSTSIDLSAIYKVTTSGASNSSLTLASTASNQSVVLVISGGSLNLTSSALNKTGDTTSDDDSNFYGLNAVAVAQNGSTLYLSGSSVVSNSTGSNGVYSTGSGSVVYASNLDIKTYGDSSRGLDATELGTIYAYNVSITTQGEHCAGLANDRGTGVIVATNATISTSAAGSPNIYCTGNITAINCTGVSTVSEIAVIEGSNNVTIYGSGTSLNSTSTTAGHGVMLYQSESGDASSGTSIFNVTGGQLGYTSKAGPFFYVTNTNAAVYLSNNVTLTSGVDYLFAAKADSWGTTGSNGGTVNLTMSAQYASGTAAADNISSMNFYLADSSYYSGVFNGNATAKVATMTIDGTSKWNVKGDSYLTGLSLAESVSTSSNISSIIGNGYTVYYLASGASALGGSNYTLTNGGQLVPATISAFAARNATRGSYIGGVGDAEGTTSTTANSTTSGSSSNSSSTTTTSSASASATSAKSSATRTALGGGVFSVVALVGLFALI